MSFAFGFSLGLEALDMRDSNRLRERRKVGFSLGLEALDRRGSNRLREREKGHVGTGDDEAHRLS